MKGFIAIAKEETVIRTSCYKEHDGIQLVFGLFPDQRWNASKRGVYWYLTREQSPAGLRLTPSALKKWFRLEEK